MKFKYNFEIMEMDDHVMAVPVGDNASSFRGIVKLNESAGYVFDRIRANKSKDEIVQDLLNDYDVSMDEANSYVDHMISELTKEGILE